MPRQPHARCQMLAHSKAKVQVHMSTVYVAPFRIRSPIRIRCKRGNCVATALRLCHGDGLRIGIINTGTGKSRQMAQKLLLLPMTNNHQQAAGTTRPKTTTAKKIDTSCNTRITQAASSIRVLALALALTLVFILYSSYFVIVLLFLTLSMQLLATLLQKPLPNAELIRCQQLPPTNKKPTKPFTVNNCSVLFYNPIIVYKRLPGKFLNIFQINLWKCSSRIHARHQSDSQSVEHIDFSHFKLSRGKFQQSLPLKR